jgi:ABC-type amino acid transport substrate-binding protein
MRRRNIFIIAAAIGLALIVGLAVALWPRQAQTDETWERVIAERRLRVGIDAAYPPFEDVTESGEIVGFDVDFAHEIGRRLGVEMTFVNLGYDGLYDALVVGEVDVLISALSVAPEQAGRVAYTLPYFNAGEFLIAPSGSDMSGMADLEGLTLAVEYGSGGDVEARAWGRRLASLEVARYPDPGAAVAAVADGEADAALVDGISARLALGDHPGLRMVQPSVTENLLAVAVRPKSKTLLEELNRVIWEMLQDGTVDELIDKWF